ncbi:MAG: S8 family serine peptidase [bacterium]|nr:S8 family serine peptidase [bacterium]
MKRLFRGLLWQVLVLNCIMLVASVRAGSDFERVLLVLEPEHGVLTASRKPHSDSLWLARAHEAVVNAARRHASDTQSGLLSRLNDLEALGEVTGIHTFWAANAIACSASETALAELKLRRDILSIEPDLPIELLPHTITDPSREPGTLDEPGLSDALVAIRAPQAWSLGLTGVGVLLANFDSGVNGANPGLSPRWRGNNGYPSAQCWFDLVEPLTSTPGDNDGHGTMTMGLQCGMIPNDTVGVAWNAQFIAAAVAEGGSTISNALLAFEWVIDPDGNPATFADVPRVLSNSWGFSGGMDLCNNVLFQAMDLAEAAGIAVFWSAGNEGPASGSIRNPANRAETSVSGFAVGGWDGETNQIWLSSSRGPSSCTPDTSLRVKPEIIAPSRNVRSTSSSSGFSYGTGTSFSAPLAAGTLALMIEANPLLAPDSLLELLMLTTVDEATPGLDNDAGYGRVDAYMACQAALTGLGWIRGMVQNESGEPILAELNVLDHPHHSASDAQGSFSLPMPAYLPAQLQVVASGFLPQTVYVTTWPQDTTYLAITLESTAQGILSGNVIDCRGLPAPGALISIPNQMIIPVVTDDNGCFLFTFNPGTFTVACSSGTCGSILTQHVQIIAGAITDIEIVLPLNPAFLCSDPDPFGYYLCDSNDPEGPTESYYSVAPEVGGKGVIHNLADDGHIPLAPPFPITFYGQTYNRIFLNSNGIVSFVRYATAYNNVQLPYNLTPALFPFWDDFSDPLGGHILSDYDPAHGTYTLDFYELPHFINFPPPTDSANFQVVFYDPAVYPSASGNTFVEFRYGRLDVTTGATIGIDRAASSTYVRYGYNNSWQTHAVPVAEGLAIRVGDSDFPSGVPSLYVEPAVFALSVGQGEVLDTSLFVHNLGSTPLAYEVRTSYSAAAASISPQRHNNALPEPFDYPKGFLPPRFESRALALDETAPDVYGYAWANSRTDTAVVYEFFDLNGIGVNLGLTRDDTTSYPRSLPWEFEFYGRVFKRYSACTNGFISFWSAARNYLNDPMNLARDPYYMIAPYWTDLNPTAGGQVLEYYDQTNDRLIVQWNEIPLWGGGPGENLTFQVILYPDGEIDLVYEHMRDASLLHTVGMKGGNSSENIEFSYNGNAIDSLMLLRVTRPDTSAASLRVLSGRVGIVPPQGQQEIKLRVANNDILQGLMQLPLTIASSDPDGSDTQVAIAMQGGTPFDPNLVITWEANSLKLRWNAHPSSNYSIWTALTGDSAYSPLVPSLSDTMYTVAIPLDYLRFYKVTLAGANAPMMECPSESINTNSLNIRSK